MQAHRIISSDGISLHLEEYGNPRGKTIVFIHGFLGSRLFFEKQIHSTLLNTHRLIVFDLRGHGLSDKPPNAYQKSRFFADDLHAIITQLQLSSVLLCAHSYGGLLVSDYLRYYGDSAISGLHLVAASTEIGTDGARAVAGPAFLECLPALLDTTSSHEALPHFIRLLTQTPLPKETYTAWLYNSQQTPVAIRKKFIARRLLNSDILSSFRKPVLLTHGEDDKIICKEASSEHQRYLPHAHYSLYPQTGHCPFWESPLRFNEELVAFSALQFP